MATWKKLAYVLYRSRQGHFFDEKDILQTILIKAWEAIDIYDETRGTSLLTHCCIRARGWTQTIYRNRSVDARLFSGDEPVYEDLTAFDMLEDDDYNTSFNDDIISMLKLMETTLSESEQLAVKMKFGIGYDSPFNYEEIGKQLYVEGCSSNISSIRMNAHKTIKQAILKLSEAAKSINL